VARVRPGTDRELRFTQTEEPDDTDEEPDEADGPADGPLPTSLDDLTTEADPQQFDQTFIAGDAGLTIQGRFDPVAGNRQVIPRVAYVISYNLVYNAARDRWEPDEGNDTAGGEGARMVYSAGASQSIPGNTNETADFDTTTYDTRDEFDSASSAVTVAEDGLYLLLPTATLVPMEDMETVRCYAEVNGDRKTRGENEVSTPASATNAATTAGGTVAQLTAGDDVTMTITNGGAGSADVDTTPHLTAMAVLQVG
jgi:hypothetical protein